LFANEGASVVVADLNQEAAERVAQEIRDGGGNAVSVGGNVANADQMKRMVGTAKVGAFKRLY
jgi:3-oxoacyl-[acyl-carrier protein] reductase